MQPSIWFKVQQQRNGSNKHNLPEPGFLSWRIADTLLQHKTEIVRRGGTESIMQNFANEKRTNSRRSTVEISGEGDSELNLCMNDRSEKGKKAYFSRGGNHY